MRYLIRLGLFLIVAIVVYNYFFGTPEEKATSKAIFHQVRDLSAASWALLKSEKAKLAAGKYDTAIDKLDGLYRDLRSRAREAQDNRLLEKVQELENQRQELELRQQQLEAAKESLGARPQQRSGRSQAEEEALRRDLQSLLQDTEQLMNEIEQ